MTLSVLQFVVLPVLAALAGVLACDGWGRLAGRALALHEQPAARQLEPALGLGVLILLGTLLNALHAYHPLLGALLVVAGIALQLGVRLPAARPQPLLVRLALLLVVATTWRWALAVPTINPNDDGPAYLVFAEKMRLL